MLIEISDFQKKLAQMALKQMLTGLPTPPPNAPTNPVDSTFDLVRSEATQLLSMLAGPGEVREPRNTFKNAEMQS